MHVGCHGGYVGIISEVLFDILEVILDTNMDPNRHGGIFKASWLPQAAPEEPRGAIWFDFGIILMMVLGRLRFPNVTRISLTKKRLLAGDGSCDIVVGLLCVFDRMLVHVWCRGATAHKKCEYVMEVMAVTVVSLKL